LGLSVSDVLSEQLDSNICLLLKHGVRQALMDIVNLRMSARSSHGKSSVAVELVVDHAARRQKISQTARLNQLQMKRAMERCVT